jgi:hypothetical protein
LLLVPIGWTSGHPETIRRREFGLVWEDEWLENERPLHVADVDRDAGALKSPRGWLVARKWIPRANVVAIDHDPQFAAPADLTCQKPVEDHRKMSLHIPAHPCEAPAGRFAAGILISENAIQSLP